MKATVFRLLQVTMYFISQLILKLMRRVLKFTIRHPWAILIAFCTVVLVALWNPHELRDREYSIKSILKNPVMIWWTQGFPATNETRKCSANIECGTFTDRNIPKKYEVQAYLFYGSQINFTDLPLPRRQQDVIWALHHEESPRNVEELMHEDVLKLFNYSSTFSRYSDFPFPLQHVESLESITSTKYFVDTKTKNMLLNEIAPILYLQSDCATSTERDSYVKQLMLLTKIDSYGTCLKNKDLPHDLDIDYLQKLNDDTFLKFVARYKFVIAIENGVCDDYITEKLWRAISVGSVPIYFGSPSVRDWLPNKNSAILLEDYPTPQLLNKHLNTLNQNDELYEKYLEHKTKKTISNKKLLKEFQVRPYQFDDIRLIEEFECFICKKLHEKRSDLGVNIVNKRHYDCPEPVSALSLNVNPHNDWVNSWHTAKRIVNEIYIRVVNS